MEFHQYQGYRPPDPPSHAPEWGAFLVVARIELLWFVCGGYLVGPAFIFLDPVFLLVFGIICARVIIRVRPRRGQGISPRGLVALIAFLASLAFVVTRPLAGVGGTPGVILVVTILDEGSGEPMGGAVVTASDGSTMLSSSITDKHGLAILEFKIRTHSTASWLLSWRSFDPKTLTVEARAASYRSSSYKIENRTQYRVNLINGGFGYFPTPITMKVELKLTRTSGTAPVEEEEFGSRVEARQE